MTRPSPENLRQQILQHLETLKIPLTSEQLDEALAAASKSRLTHLELLERLLSGPASQRRQRSIERRVRLAKFPDPATLEAFDWKFNEATIEQATFLELATGEFVRRRDNLVLVGKSGVGKSHLIQGIGRSCCALGYNVRYTTSAQLLEELTAASGDKTLSSRVRYYCRFDLLIIDEFGFDKLERLEYPESSSLLYKVIDSRSRRGSTAMITNIDFDGWTDYLGDPPLAMALLDRVVDGAIIQRMDGKSYREFRAQQQKAQKSRASRPRKSTKA